MAAQAPSSCSGPRSWVNVCSGWREKRRPCGSSAAKGVPPLTCATQGPGAIVDATSTITRSGTQRRMSSASPSRSDTPLSARRAATALPTRPRAPMTLTLSIMSLAPVPRGYRARCSIPPGGGRLVPQTPRQAALDRRPLVVEHRVPGAVAVLSAADEHVLAVDTLEHRAHRLHRAAGAVVPRVGLQLDPATAPDLEGMAQHEQLRLDVHSGAPGIRMEPRPADLDRPVLGPQREEPCRADDAVAGQQRHERELDAPRGGAEGAVDPGVELGARRRLLDRQPRPGARVAGCLPQPVGVPRLQRLEPDVASLERRRAPRSHVSRLRPCRSTSTHA